MFADDADIPFLFHIGVLSDTDVSSHISVNPNVEILESVISDEPKDFRSPNFSISVVRKRLEMFLKVFSVVVSPKQLYLHQLLFNYFSTLLASPDLVLAKLAFQCLMTYKPAFLAPYKENLSHFLDNKLLRDELVLFNPSVVEGKIDALHRVDLIPVLTRLLYGRYLSKASGAKAREISSSR